MRVYLAGPIFGMSDATCEDWRSEAKSLLPKHWETLDPMARDYRGREDDCVNETVEGDLLDIRRCHLMLAHVAAPSWGTAMEIRQAAVWGIPIFGIVGDGRISPWLQYHTCFRAATLAEIVDEMRTRYLPNTIGNRIIAGNAEKDAP